MDTRWLCYFNSESQRKKKTTLRVFYKYEGDRYTTVFNGGSFLTRPVENLRRGHVGCKKYAVHGILYPETYLNVLSL